MLPSDLETLRAELVDATPEALLSWSVRRFPGQVVLATSLGEEDQVLLDLAARGDLLPPKGDLGVFTLDTGRLFPETLDLLAETERRYSVRVRVLSPDTAELEALVADGGINLFRDSVEARHRCCAVRKLTPLKRALSGARLWITGLRHAQSTHRSALDVLSWDETHGLLKLCPLLDWSDEALHTYVEAHHVPTNPLHARGYTSIGCAPCTRPVAPGDDPRSGRWWWEQDTHRECGLHFVNGQLVRSS